MTPIDHAGHFFASIDRKVGRIPLYIGGAVVLLIVAIVLFLSQENWNWARGPIARFASARTGRDIRLEGDLRAHLLSWTPEVNIGGLKIGNPTWQGPGDTVEVGDARVQARLLPLFLLRLELPLVDLQSMKLDLLRDTSGRENWALSQKPSAKPLKLPPITRFLIQDGHLHLVDQTRKVQFTGTVEASETPLDKGGKGFQMQGQGSLNSEKFLLAASGGPLIAVQRDKPYPFTLDVHAGASHITADAQISRPFDLGRMQGSLALNGPDLSKLYDLTGVAFPNTPPYKLAAHFERQENKYAFTDLHGTLGATDLEGQLTVDRVNGRRKLDADLSSEHLNFPDILTVMGGPPTRVASAPLPAQSGQIKLPVPPLNKPASPAKPQPTMARRVLPDAPLYRQRLLDMDANVSYRAKAIKGGIFSVQSGSLKLALLDGVLTLDPVALNLSQGRLTGKVRVDARTPQVKSDLDMRLTNVSLQDVLKQKGASPAIEGTLEARAKLSAVGDSVHKAAAASNGEVVFVIPHGRMRQVFAELLGVNVGRGLYMLLSKDPKQTDMRCAVAQFDVHNGLMTAQQFVIDTGVVTATGSGTIDLGQEKLDLKIKGHTKHPEILRLWTPIEVGGVFSRPSLGLDAGQTAAQAGASIGLGALIGPLTVILPFLSPGLAKDADCQSLVADAKTSGAPVKTSQTAPYQQGQVKPVSGPSSTAPQH